MRRLVWLGAVLLCFTVAGCGGDDSANTQNPATDPAVTGDMTGAIEEAGLDPNMSAEDYAKGGKKE